VRRNATRKTVKEVDIDALIAQARYEGPAVTADRLVGVDACLRQLQGQIALSARPELAERFGLQPSGTLFIGKPGTGKTLLARYLAGHLGIPLYQFSADEFGSDPDNLHEVFRRLRGRRVLIFIDEISLIAQRREWMQDPADRRMLSALLVSLDGLAAGERKERPWVIGACTPDIHLDSAIHRSGRLGVIIEFAPPSEQERRQLFELYLAGVPHSVSADDIGRLAEISGGATGADIADYVSQAASEVLVEQAAAEPVIEYRHLEKVVARRGFIGAERPERVPRWDTAVHEAAHPSPPTTSSAPTPWQR
jgi:SpoVK/Ycf46/Vps4 family AAA+-type ATPase